MPHSAVNQITSLDQIVEEVGDWVARLPDIAGDGAQEAVSILAAEGGGRVPLVIIRSEAVLSGWRRVSSPLLAGHRRKCAVRIASERFRANSLDVISFNSRGLTRSLKHGQLAYRFHDPAIIVELRGCCIAATDENRSKIEPSLNKSRLSWTYPD